MTTPPRQRPPILDDARRSNDASQYWSDPPVQSKADSARYWAAKHGEALQTIQDLRSDLSAARFERSVWPSLAFAVGVLCGMGLSWWM